VVSRPGAAPGFNFKSDLSSTQGARPPVRNSTSAIVVNEFMRKLDIGGNDLGDFFMPVLILLVALALALAVYFIL
jgi:hypothetical protein